LPAFVEVQNVRLHFANSIFNSLFVNFAFYKKLQFPSMPVLLINPGIYRNVEY